MMLFAVSVIIFIICFSVFSIYQGYFNGVAVDDGLTQLEAIVSSNIFKLVEKNPQTNSTIQVEIPKTIGGQQYEIELGDKTLNITTASGRVKSSGIYSLGDVYEFQGGRILSTNGKFVIYKKENRIILT
jgi:hypothetical protein